MDRHNSTEQNSYDYSRVPFDVDLKSKVAIRCVKHNEWFRQTLLAHKQGSHSCKQCQFERKSQKRIDFEEFERRARKTHGDKYSLILSNSHRNVNRFHITAKNHPRKVLKTAN